MYDTETRVEELRRFEVLHAEDDYRNNLFECPAREDELQAIIKRRKILERTET